MNNTQAWAFLVSRNQYLDYRTVVAPDFMCQVGASSLVAKVAEGEFTEKGSALYREIYNSKVGNLTIVFRVIEANSEEIGIADNGILKDSFGREIYLIEGILLQEIIPDVAVSQKNIEDIHKQLLENYREFWDYTTSASATASEPFTLENNQNDKQLKLSKLQNYNIVTKDKIHKEEHKSNVQSYLWENKATNKYPGEITSVAYSPKGNCIALRYDRTVVIKDLNTEEEITLCSENKILMGDCPTPITFDTTGQFIASGLIESLDRNIVKLWNINTNQGKDIGEHSWTGLNRVKAIAFTPDSKIVASGGGDKTIHMWDVKTENLELGELVGHESDIKSIAISPDGKYMISGDDSGVIKVWDLISKKEIFHIQAHPLPINSLAFSPDGQNFVSASDDYNIKLWNVKTWKEECKIGQHSDIVNCVTFSPDGKLIASASDDCRIKIWKLNSQPPVYILDKHTKPVTSVAFSPDSQTIISGSKDFTIRIWQRL